MAFSKTLNFNVFMTYYTMTYLLLATRGRLLRKSDWMDVHEKANLLLIWFIISVNIMNL